MPVTRVESIVYGTDDVAAGIKYFEEWGLPCREKGASGAKFALPTGQTVEIRGEGDSALPAAIEKGPTVRETVWGVDTKDALDAVGAELARDRDLKRDADGTLHTKDDIGLPIALRVAAAGVDPGVPKHRGINRVVDPQKRPEMIRIGHVVYFCPKDAAAKASAFYTDRLKFRMTEQALDLGNFMRCPASPWHHNLFFLAVMPRTGWNHVAFDVADLEEVMNGGHNMLKQGYKAYSSPGRHIMGSNIFWYFNAVTGGQTEYSADMDMFDDGWKTRVWEHNPGIDMWNLATSDIVPPRSGPPQPGR
jgi:catechol 2,3-dioxygenase-like lactoylglutathione lyase family enzyme